MEIAQNNAQSIFFLPGHHRSRCCDFSDLRSCWILRHASHALKGRRGLQLPLKTFYIGVFPQLHVSGICCSTPPSSPFLPLSPCPSYTPLNCVFVWDSKCQHARRTNTISCLPFFARDGLEQLYSVCFYCCC